MDSNELPVLAYKDGENSVAPIPAHEQQLPTVTAEPWLEISKQGLQLEGLCFDRQGNLLLCEVFGGTIFHVNLSDKKVTELFKSHKQNPAAVKIHKDGRLFVCYLGDFESTGGIFMVDADGNDAQDIVSDIGTEYCIDDLVFDSKGGFYFTDFRGYSTNLKGGVYYVSPDFKSITPVIQNLAVANGVALSTDEKTLWVTETNANRLHRIDLLEDGVTIAPFGASIPYYFTGHEGPDSCCIDSDDNLYVAMYGQGKVLVFNKKGSPIGQILMPGRDQGHMLRSTHPAFIPGTDQLIICANDIENDGGSWIYTVKAFAKGHQSYQFH
ncbi:MULTISPECIES: SMP-30/gluconolactonase/LRE family protein [Staphylococcus]|uniref:SMP-30/gluconolactonase/LRE family protein n=1 Tax=Staphylococcus TaxID=1279 RepID=UPI000254AEFD|nr:MULTISPECIES: SMP-30/gluconolactonase/LRE family protein [Staphylococcus]EHY93534.1 drp35 [Staphylococcus saprophyticus subsp. saprophyticus KACC 16562]MBF2781975.1 SMP-30/gluconolactonase/LRE family protein [Staphylococcus saprophyticus]MDT3925405.1 SMP-30/gluconolactonase/LRE family protein [Staphylococcus saprophyticus]MDW4340738.1 SMP-30/gluconolactonase/LRE family protein [Staphylococcus saprophyticus]MDW4386609.1 SMP-30/gluconolactonase/LRE family protein [Staphylococcus saprophyticus